MTTSAPVLRASATAPPSPAATRLRRRGWRDPRLAVGVALVSFSVLLGARLLGGADDTVAVVAVAGDRAAGQALGPDDIVIAAVRFDSPHDADRYLSGADRLPDGLVLTRDVGAGELLPRAALSSDADSRLVEVPLSVAAEAVPGSVEVGSLVDVWVMPGEASAGAGARRAGRVLEGVPVLAAPGPAGTLGPTGNRQVVVGVERDGPEAPDLGRALGRLARGTVVLTGRATR